MIQIDISMPENCAECLFLQYGFCILHDGIPAHKTDEKKRPDWCPLMEVPDDLH